MHAEISFTQYCCYWLAVVRGSTIIVCNFFYIMEALSMAEEDSVISCDKNETLKNANDNVTIEDSIGCVYGKLVLLGYNGTLESSSTYAQGRKHRSKMILRKRLTGNGIKKHQSSSVSIPPSQSQVVRDASRHVVSYSYNRNHTVLVEYSPDPYKDMFQIGRSSEDQIDFTVVDTWLAANALHPGVYSEPGSENAVLDAFRVGKNARCNIQRPISSTISRYACRIQINRDYPHRAFLYAAGFDSSRNIFLGEKATKWTKYDGEIDGLTTNGILILHPNTMQRQNSGQNTGDHMGMFVWREVSVDGDIYNIRETRSSTKRGELLADETNELQDGTLIDLCGATLLWRTAEGLTKSPCRSELESRLNEINAGKPQCPVNLNTLIIPRKKSAKSYGSSRQPYVYLNCGHVQGKHAWGKNDKSDSGTLYKCPICLVDSSKIIQLVMGMESAFHLDSDALDYAFNPCGHVASLSTVRYWSRIPLPHGTSSFHPVCPFCTSLLSMDKPYVRLIFQDHCSDS
ncbi:pellino family protein [Loa loa]|uniref:Pellino family protein n=2 Tax=Loa loa TaxID=7209 RepID=A0A1S0U7R0_LOALO|nr:pellino family protein [Loa loa]EFO26155.2 pellino family protein [Loa loa]